MIVHKDAKGYVPMLDGVKRKTLAVGEMGMMVEFTLDEGASIPAHSHPHEQIGYLISGELLFTIGSQEVVVKPGDSWAIPGNVSHSAKVLKPAVAAEVFVPLREDYID